MSRDIIILVPSGRRIKVHCTADTSILQVLEDVCAKQGIQPSNYDLKHHNHVLDLTTTVRFCNIPNKATLEMVEVGKKRIESNVTIGLMLDDGDRRTAEFSPNTSLYDLIINLAATELLSLQNPTISYMRQEVSGVSALKEKTLRHLGLIAGRAILRLLDKTEAVQANVSSVYRKVKVDVTEDNISADGVKKDNDKNIIVKEKEKSFAGPSGVNKDKDLQQSYDPIKIIKKEKEKKKQSEDNSSNWATPKPEPVSETIENNMQPSSTKPMTQEDLERRWRIEEEVSFIGSQKAIAFTQPDKTEDELADLPDDFYELSIEEVRRMYHELQQQRIDLENAPLITSAKRDEMQQQASQLQLIHTYKNVVVRIQFPDNIILQGVFLPSNTIEDIQNFVKEHLHDPCKPFLISSTPLKETLNPKMTLLEARFVPCVHMHFKWVEGDSGQQYLKKEIYSKQTTSDAASILASKYRAPTRRKLEDAAKTQESRASTSKAQQSKIPKWFK